MSVEPTIGGEYAVGIGRRRAVVLRTGLDWSDPGGFTVQPGRGVDVRWIGPPTTSHPGEQQADTVETVHVSDVKLPWLAHIEREDARSLERARVDRMTAEVYAALGWDGQQRAGVMGVRVPLELVHAALVGGADV